MKNKNEKKKKYTKEFVHNIPQKIERVWYILRDTSLLELLMESNNVFPLIIKEGTNTWKVGTEVKGMDKKFVEFSGKIIKIKNYPEFKKIKWEIINSTKDIKCIVNYQLYDINDTNSTIFIFKISFEKENDLKKFKESEPYSFLKNNFESLIDKVNTFLNDSSIHLINYESAIIQAPMEEIWEIVINPNKLDQIAPKVQIGFDEKVPFNPTPTPGDIIKITSKGKEHFLIKVLKFEKNPKWGKWIFLFETIHGEPKIVSQKVGISLTKVNEDDVHLGLFHDFNENITQEEFNILGEKKIYIINCLKEYFEKKNKGDQ